MAAPTNKSIAGDRITRLLRAPAQMQGYRHRQHFPGNAKETVLVLDVLNGTRELQLMFSDLITDDRALCGVGC